MSTGRGWVVPARAAADGRARPLTCGTLRSRSQAFVGSIRRPDRNDVGLMRTSPVSRNQLRSGPRWVFVVS